MPSSRRVAADGKPAYAQPRRLDHHDRSGRQLRFGPRQRVENHSRLGLRATGRTPSPEQNRRAAHRAEREQGAEVGVRGHDNPTLGCRPFEDDGVGRVRQAEVANVDGVVSRRAQGDGQNRRERVVDEQFHGRARVMSF